MKKADKDNQGYAPYGPATGKTNPGRNPKDYVDDTPYDGDRGPDGKVKPGHVPGGPGHKGCGHK